MKVTETERYLYFRVEALTNNIEEKNETIKELRRQLKHSNTQCSCK